MVYSHTWDKQLAQMLEALSQALEKGLSTSTNASIKRILQVQIKNNEIIYKL